MDLGFYCIIFEHSFINIGVPVKYLLMLHVQTKKKNSELDEALLLVNSATLARLDKQY